VEITVEVSIEQQSGTLNMPAGAWGKTGTAPGMVVWLMASGGSDVTRKTASLKSSSELMPKSFSDGVVRCRSSKPIMIDSPFTSANSIATCREEFAELSVSRSADASHSGLSMSSVYMTSSSKSFPQVPRTSDPVQPF
jgi:hypothetical protein